MAQCALAVVLLAGAGQFLRSLNRLRGVEAGFDAQPVVDVRIEFPAAASALPDVEQALRAIGSLDGVQAAGFIDDMFIGSAQTRSISIAGRDVSTGRMTDACHRGLLQDDARAAADGPLPHGCRRER